MHEKQNCSSGLKEVYDSDSLLNDWKNDFHKVWFQRGSKELLEIGKFCAAVKACKWIDYFPLCLYCSQAHTKDSVEKALSSYHHKTISYKCQNLSDNLWFLLVLVLVLI